MVKIKMTKKELLMKLRNLFLVIVGTTILGFGVGVFILPFDLVTGGVPGIAILLKKIIPIEAISVELYTTIVTWVLFFLGLIFLGKDFALKTLTSTIVYPIAINLSSLLVSPDVLKGFFYLQGSAYQQIAIVLASVFGGAFVGAGCAITFLGGGSTGGVDIISLIISKYIPRIKSSVSMFIIDGLLVVLGMFILNDFVLTLLGIVSAFICAIVVDFLFVGESKAFVCEIITDKYEEINLAIREKIDRTTTLIDVVGGYSKEKKKMVMVSFTMNQYSQLTSLISNIDKDAFMTIHRAHEINGKGFSKNKEAK
ncbi:MAG: YitT family protein [Bacilli bacterium]|nr:YitT family protein [Bacillales bacterium]MDY2574788.1 YitT family protein [Bacilli bacterium]